MGEGRAILRRTEIGERFSASEASFSERILRAERVSANRFWERSEYQRTDFASEASLGEWKFGERSEFQRTDLASHWVQALDDSVVIMRIRKAEEKNIHPLCIYKAYTISRLIKTPKKIFACGAYFGGGIYEVLFL